MRTLQPRKPFVETWKCIRKPCKKTPSPGTVTQRPVTLKPRKTLGVNINVVNPAAVKSLPRFKVTPRPSEFRTFATVQGIRLESVKPYTFRPRHRAGLRTTAAPSSSSPTSSTTPSTTVSTKTEETVSTTTISPRKNFTLIPEEFPYSLLWVSPGLKWLLRDVLRNPFFLECPLTSIE